MLAGKDHLSFYQTINNKLSSAPQWVFVDSYGDRQLTGQALADIVGLPDAGDGDMGQGLIWPKPERLRAMRS